MKQVLIRQGQVLVEDIPVPQAEPGRILVRVDHSCISAGTELSGVRSSGVPLWKKALQQPDKVKKVFQMVASQGISKTRSLVEGKLSVGNPTGYSAAGIVIEVGAGVDDLKVGDRVACAGAQCSFHAEYIAVPRNLAVKIPDGVALDKASTVTLGSIAMQGVRRAKPTLGEVFVVIGLGILGQLTVQMLKANGCRAIGVDLDPNRIDLSLKLGLDFGISSNDESVAEQVDRLTDGFGADGVIITAATPSDKVVATAFNVCRKKGRVVLVGDVGLHLNRADFYEKELDFFISSSYGPGRYDNNYEEKGLDYPIGYVRWTENRNMGEYLRLVAENKIRLESLIQAVYPIDQASEAYNRLKNIQDKPLMVLLSYPQHTTDPVRRVSNPSAIPSGGAKIRVALVGAGGFARGMHLPNIQALPQLYHLRAIMSRTGHNAQAAASQFAAEYATTDFQEILNDRDIDLVVIATRHDLHTAMALQALQAGKHVLVEKPLALNRQELTLITDYFAQAGGLASSMTTGFNRRFSPCARGVHEVVAKRGNPMVINYSMNAGYLALDHWVHTAEGGGRNVGEACHIYDLFTYLTGSKLKTVTAHSITPATGYYSPRDNFVATITFEDGSVATLTYTAMGSVAYPKENMVIHCDGKTIVMDDYKKLSGYGVELRALNSRVSEKGQKEEIAAVAQVIKNGGEWPIPLWQQVQAMEIAFAVEAELGGNC